MELAKMTLQNYLRSNKNEQRDLPFANNMRQIHEGMEYLHSLSKIHRNFKPGNVLNNGNTAKLGDSRYTKDLYKTTIYPGERFIGPLYDKVATAGYMPARSREHVFIFLYLRDTSL